MFGKNPIRPPEKGDGSTLYVQNIFYTLQGEGPFAGHPSIFIRLGGCNLACDFCDTEFESFKPMTLEDIMQRVTELAPKEVLIVLTGGEPFRQPIEALCERLITDGYPVQLETNGTLYRPVHPAVQIVCSPKTTTGLYVRIRDDLLCRLNALKFIVSENHPHYRGVPEVGQSDYGIPVYVQPMDEQNTEKNEMNMHYARDLALSRGYRLSLQLHKWLGIE